MIRSAAHCCPLRNAPREARTFPSVLIFSAARVCLSSRFVYGQTMAPAIALARNGFPMTEPLFNVSAASCYPPPVVVDTQIVVFYPHTGDQLGAVSWDGIGPPSPPTHSFPPLQGVNERMSFV